MGTAPDVRVPLGPGSRNSWAVSSDTVDLVRAGPPPVPLPVPALPQRLVLDLRRCALIVIDMQRDFCSADGWLASIGVDVSAAARPVPVIAELAAALRENDVPIVWVNWGTRPDRANLPPGVLHVYRPTGVETGIGDPLAATGAPVLQAGSSSAELVDGLVAEPGDIRLDKHRMSGFWDTALDSILRNLRVDTLLFAGVNADQCVLSTLTDAACLGYDVVMVEDACATTSPPFCWEATVYNVRQCFGFTLLAADVVAALGERHP